MKYRFLAFVIGWLSCWTGVAAGADPSLVFDPAGSTRFVKQLIFTKDGSQLVSVGADRVIRIWDVQSAKTIRTIRDQVSACEDCRVSTIALSPDNTYLAAGGSFPDAGADTRFAIYIYNFETGQRITFLKGHKAPVTALAFSPSGTQLASGSFVSDLGRNTDLESVRTWKIGAQGWEASKILSQHEEAVISLAFSPDENQLVSSSYDSNAVLWDLKTDEAQVLDKHNDFVYGAIFSPDGRFIVSAGLDRKICLWDSEGVFVKELPEQPSGITSLAVSPNKDRFRILIGLANGESRILSVPDGKVIVPFKVGDDKVFAATFSAADENVLASSGGSNGEIWVWRADNPKEPKLFAGNGQTIWKVGFSKDGDSIAFGTRHLRDVPNRYGELEQVIRLKSAISSKISQRSLAYRISLGGPVGTGADYYSEIDETREGNSTYKLQTRYGETVKRKDGGDDPVRLNELRILKNDQMVDEIKRDSTKGRTHRAFTFTPDGRYVISAGEDGYLALYQTNNPHEPLHLFKGHTSDVWSVAVSPDGRFIISGSSDQTIKLWDIKSEQYLVSFFVGSDSEWIAWTPQGYYTSSIRGDRYIGWQVEETVAQQPAFYAADQFEKIFHRPEVVSQYIDVPDIKEALRETPIMSTAQQSIPVDRLAVFTAEDLKKSLPPKINIISPEDTETFRQRLIPVKVFVTSDNLPITEVVISLNGFVKGTFKGGGAESSKKVEIETTIALKPGKNTLVVMAMNENGSSETEVRNVSYDISTPPNAPGQIKPVPLARAVRVRDSNSPTSHRYGKSFVLEFIDESTTASLMLPVGFRTTEAVLPDDPPTFRILSPEKTPTSPSTSNDFIPMEIQIGTVPQNTNLRITVNGAERWNFGVHSGQKWVGQTTLDLGPNDVAVMTTTNGVDSRPETRSITTVAQTKPNLIFLGIGISKYSNLDPPLQYGDKDATDLEALLLRLKNSSIFAEVKTKVLSNADATHPKILEAVAWLNSEAKSENDLRVVLISGHGGLYGQTLRQYYFYAKNQLPNADPELWQSANWHTVLQRLLDSPPRVDYAQGHLVMFIDTCRAGNASPRVSLDFNGVGGFVYFGSSGSNVDSFETNGNGVFTRAVLEGLSGDAPDSNNNGEIDYVELYQWLIERVPALNSKQQVQFDPATGLQPFAIGLHQLPAPAVPPISYRRDPKP